MDQTRIPSTEILTLRTFTPVHALQLIAHGIRNGFADLGNGDAIFHDDEEIPHPACPRRCGSGHPCSDSPGPAIPPVRPWRACWTWRTIAIALQRGIADNLEHDVFGDIDWCRCHSLSCIPFNSVPTSFIQCCRPMERASAEVPQYERAHQKAVRTRSSLSRQEKVAFSNDFFPYFVDPNSRLISLRPMLY